MPTGTLYWWGWKAAIVEDATAANGYSGLATQAPIHNTNNIEDHRDGGVAYEGIGLTTMAKYTVAHFLMSNPTNCMGHCALGTSKNLGYVFSSGTTLNSEVIYPQSTTIKKYTLTATNANVASYPVLGKYGTLAQGRAFTLYALWTE